MDQVKRIEGEGFPGIRIEEIHYCVRIVVEWGSVQQPKTSENSYKEVYEVASEVGSQNDVFVRLLMRVLSQNLYEDILC